MLRIITLLLLSLAQTNRGMDHISELLKKHPTWTFELESVDSMVKKGMEVIKDVDPTITEDDLREKIKRQLGPETTHIVRKTGDPKWPKVIPQTYDIRDKFKECADLISKLEDEGPCYTDSPAVVASVASDRYCIFTNGTHKDMLSPEYLAGCAEFCTMSPSSFRSWKYATEIGLPSGGGYNSNSGCLPYTLEPCEHTREDFLEKSDKTQIESASEKKGKLKPCTKYMAYDHECPKKCSNSKYSRSLEDDLKKFTAFYHTSTNEYGIRSEIYNNGPVATSIIMYSDFFDYKNGIYVKDTNATFVAWDKYFKLIGWGTENGIKYWLAINTWSNWGDKKVFKIPRGTNYLYVEWFLTAGTFDPL